MPVGQCDQDPDLGVETAGGEPAGGMVEEQIAVQAADRQGQGRVRPGGPGLIDQITDQRREVDQGVLEDSVLGPEALQPVLPASHGGRVAGDQPVELGVAGAGGCDRALGQRLDKALDVPVAATSGS